MTTTGFARRTHTDYLAGYAAGAVFLPSLVSGTQLYDAGATPASSKTAVNYDCLSNQTACSITKAGTWATHDDTAYGAGYATRGNPTMTSRWFDATNAFQTTSHS